MAKRSRNTNSLGRKRRVTGWTLLTLGVLVAGLWVATGTAQIRYIAPYVSIDLLHGHLRIERPEFPINLNAVKYKSGWSIGPLDGYMERWTWGGFPIATDYQYQVSAQAGTRGHGFIMMFWPLPLLLWTPAALLLRSGIVARRRTLTGKCKSCGYDLAGLSPEAPCPECGKTVAAR